MDVTVKPHSLLIDTAPKKRLNKQTQNFIIPNTWIRITGLRVRPACTLELQY